MLGADVVRKKKCFFNARAVENLMDVRAKQRPCYQTGLVVLKLYTFGFAPRHLKRLSLLFNLIKANLSTIFPFSRCSSIISGTSRARTCPYQTPSG